MRKYRLRVGLDVDDTLYDCNAYALHILNDRHPDVKPATVHEITGWGKHGVYAEERLALYTEPDFVRNQPILPGAQDFVRELAEIADVFFVTAVPANCMSARAERLIRDFPEVPPENAIIGTRKDVISLDILLDDGAHNISNSCAAYPVLMRRPWNTHLSGLLSVNGYSDFLHFCRMVLHSFTEKTPDLSGGGIICLVGPTGSMKGGIARAMMAKDRRYIRPRSATSRPRRSGEAEDTYQFLTEEKFLEEKEAGKFMETTVYNGYHYGTSMEEIQPIVESGCLAVIPLDICGALTVKNLFGSRAMLVYVERERQAVLRSILRRDIPDDDKIRRILSLDYEYSNGQMCDMELPVGDDPVEAAERLMKRCSR